MIIMIINQLIFKINCCLEILDLILITKQMMNFLLIIQNLFWIMTILCLVVINKVMNYIDYNDMNETFIYYPINFTEI
jgi:hypothetical protein